MGVHVGAYAHKMGLHLALGGLNMARKQNTWLHVVRIALVAAGLLVFTSPAIAAETEAPQKAGDSDPTNPIPWKT